MTIPTIPTINAAELPPAWIAERRAIVVRDGHAIRAGQHNTIEVQSINTGAWIVLQLPDKATQFTTTADRDAVLSQLQGYRHANQ